MLVLSRKLNEEIVISEDITIKIVGIENDKVKIGISAPKDIKVYRKELIDDIKSVNAESTEASAALLEKLADKLSGNK